MRNHSALAALLLSTIAACFEEAIPFDPTLIVTIAIPRAGPLAVDSTRHRIYVTSALADYQSQDLIAIDGETNDIVAQLPGFSFTHAVAVDPDRDRVYLLEGFRVWIVEGSTLSNQVGYWLPAEQRYLTIDRGADQIRIGANTTLDATTHEVTATLTSHSFNDEAIHEGRRLIYRTRWSSDGISIFDADTLRWVGNAQLGEAHHEQSPWVVIDDQANRIHVRSDQTVWSVDGESLEASKLELFPSHYLDITIKAMAVDRRRHRLYISTMAAQVLAIDTTTNQLVKALSIDRARRIKAIAVDEAANRVYVSVGADGDSDFVAVIDGS